jgi:hypothetical protein
VVAIDHRFALNMLAAVSAPDNQSLPARRPDLDVQLIQFDSRVAAPNKLAARRAAGSSCSVIWFGCASAFVLTTYK